MPSKNNKLIAKNTLMLYFRMLLTMGVSLFTVRVVLNTLGSVDYGLYNVVGGIVAMFSFLSGTMTAASQRFLAFELGRKDYDQLNRTFGMTLLIYVILAILILILSETIGLWFLNNKMNIPAERMNAAIWVYQFSVLSLTITMLRTPYNASIIAHEKMNIYAYVSIIEVVLKLLIVYLLVLFSFDKLKLYSILMFSVTLLIALIYIGYSRQKFQECRFSFYWEKSLFKEILCFSGWSLWGAMAFILKSQGTNILFNIFFGPIVNAACGIAYQVNTAVNLFVHNFMTATRPQITKYYAANERKKMFSLVFQSSKWSFLLLFAISMPILIETNYIFTLWLKEVPEYVILFTKLVLINTLIDSLSHPLMTAAQATGKIKQYQSIVGGVMMFNLPLSYIFLKCGFPPQVAFYIAITISIINLALRLIILKNMIGLPIVEFVRNVIIRILSISIIAYIIPIVLLRIMNDGIIRFSVIVVVGFLWICAVIYAIGISKNEKAFAIQTIKKIYFKFKPKYIG